MNDSETSQPFHGWAFLTADGNLCVESKDSSDHWTFERETKQKQKTDYSDFFISYRRDGGASNARLLYEVLKLRGLNGFIDAEKLGQGDYPEALTRNIKKANNFILVVTPGAFESVWVVKEFKEALDSNKKIIPLFMDGITRFPDNLDPDNLDPSINELKKMNAIILDHKNFEANYNQLVDWLVTPHVKLVKACFAHWENSKGGLDDMIEAWKSISEPSGILETIAPLLRKAWQGSNDGNKTQDILRSIGTTDLKSIAEDMGVEHKGNRVTLLNNINDRLRGNNSYLIDEDRVGKKEGERYYRVSAYMAEIFKSGDKLKQLKEVVENLELKPKTRLSSKSLMDALFDSSQIDSVDVIFDYLRLNSNEIKDICAEFCESEGRTISSIRAKFRAWVDYEDRAPARCNEPK